MKHKRLIHPNSVPPNSAHVTRTKNWCKKLEKITMRVMACQSQEELDSIWAAATEISEDIAKYKEEYRACDVASRRLIEATTAPTKLETLEHLTEVGLWLNTIGLCPYLATR